MKPTLTRLSACTVSLATILVAGACPDSATAPPAERLTISILQSKDTLRFIGDTAHFNATVHYPQGGSNGYRITWAAEGGVVAIDPVQGVATALRNGTATITARTEGASRDARIVVDTNVR